MAKKHACTDPHHHVDDADAFVHAVERACTERGLRLTPIRANVLRLIADAGKPVKAYELLEKVREGKGTGADAPPTVYRAGIAGPRSSPAGFKPVYGAPSPAR